jgi:hypothetical protein
VVPVANNVLAESNRPSLDKAESAFNGLTVADESDIQVTFCFANEAYAGCTQAAVTHFQLTKQQQLVVVLDYQAIH